MEYKQIQINSSAISTQNLQQRMILNKNFQKEICDWILFEIKNSKTNTKKIIHIEDIQSLFNFTIISLQPILQKINIWYNFEKNIKLEILDIYFIDTNLPEKEKIENTMDNENLVIKILLQNKCNILFEDGIISKLKMGDGIVYKSNIKNKIINNQTENTYFLVVKIGIIKSLDI